jgi:predicted transcriptional regulator
MFKELDDLDRSILKRVSENPGLCIREVIEPCFLHRAETPLRIRIRTLALRGLITLKPGKYRTRCYPAKPAKTEPSEEEVADGI